MNFNESAKENNLIKIKRALISVSDKRGIETLAQTLLSFGCEIISTGGTKKILEEAGINVTDISQVTGNPEAFGGRMKTISFQIESALLFDREKDKREAEKLGIHPIDMVVCNLYPFEKVKNEGADREVLIENIDIGGPTMIRAAAKNYKYAAVITNPSDYETIIEELKENNGALSNETRFRLMRTAFNSTADYDDMIASTMDELAGERSIRLSFGKAKELRYGENSHQEALFFRGNGAEDSLYDMNVLHGKELSYNNIVDIYGALDAVRDIKRNGCAIIKHTNPCGLCEGEDQRQVFERAWEGDPVSAFGSVIAFNQKADKSTVEFLQLNHEDKMQRKFVEVICAPGFTPDAFEYLSFHKSLRVVEFDPARLMPIKDMKFLYNSLLYQTADSKLTEKIELVTEAQSDVNKNLLEFGMIAVRQLKSNAIAVVRELSNGYFQLLGMGCGQPNRVNSTELALKRCRDNLKNEYQGSEDNLDVYINEQMAKAVLVSDAFFPFSDNIDLCAEYGVKTIFQPGGSIRDKSVIKRCDEKGIAMVFTGVRHFKH
jgi:phosphoribosylaminoimidazolecarboxamide formyltransferase/IMP cyclohydrolase